MFGKYCVICNMDKAMSSWSLARESVRYCIALMSESLKCLS